MLCGEPNREGALAGEELGPPVTVQCQPAAMGKDHLGSRRPSTGSGSR